MTTFTSLELNLMRLGWLRTEMRIIHEEYPTIRWPKGEFHLRAIVRYYLGVRLHDFIEIREMICKDFVDRNKMQLDAALKSFWEPIVKHKRAIDELRKLYLAHMQQKQNFERQIGQILSERKYPSSHADAKFFAGCAWKYCDAVIANFPMEWKSAIEKYRIANQNPPLTVNIRHEAEVESALANGQQQANTELKAKGFNTLK